MRQLPPRGRFSTSSAAISEPPYSHIFIGVWFHVARGVEQVGTERGEAGLQLSQGWLSKVGEAIEMKEEDRVGVRGGHD